jgi:hypothetical protein
LTRSDYPKDEQRIADGSTVRRWMRRRIASCWTLMRMEMLARWLLPTILAWDWAAISRILHVEGDSP